MVPRDCDIARVSGVTNAVAVEGDFIGSVMLSGPGAGGNATASAVVGDIIDLARGVRVPPLGRPAASLQPYRQARMQAHEGGYYLRLKVRDRPGAFAAIARRMAEAGISLDSIVQRNRPLGTAPKRERRGSAAGHHHHAFDDRGGGARRARQHRGGRRDLRPAADDPDRGALMRAEAACRRANGDGPHADARARARHRAGGDRGGAGARPRRRAARRPGGGRRHAERAQPARRARPHRHRRGRARRSAEALRRRGSRHGRGAGGRHRRRPARRHDDLRQEPAELARRDRHHAARRPAQRAGRLHGEDRHRPGLSRRPGRPRHAAGGGDPAARRGEGREAARHLRLHPRPPAPCAG